jgi:cyclic pyranopterin monophosphate synthase
LNDSRRLSHIDESGAARMVDVGGKEETERTAVAEAIVRMEAETAEAVRRGDGPKGEVLGTARLAGIQAAKRTSELVPLTHPLPLTFVDVRADVEIGVDGGRVRLRGEARTKARTGVEMEAMTAAAVAALTVYDMVKAIEQGVEIVGVRLLHKRGGRTTYRRAESPE